MRKAVLCLLLAVLLPISSFASQLPDVIAKLDDDQLTELFRMVVFEMYTRSMTGEDLLQHTSAQPQALQVSALQPFGHDASNLGFSIQDALDFVQNVISQQPYSETFVTYDPPSTPRPTFAPLIHLEENDIVWISDTGVRYHTTPDCSGMRSPCAVSLAEARAKGLTACRDCAYWLVKTEE